MRQTKDLFQKIRDTKGTFHAKAGTVQDRYGTVQDRNSMDVTEAKILRGGKNIQKNATEKILGTKQP